MFGLELPEIIILVVVLAVLFGTDKIGNFAKSLGRFGGEFKKGQLEVEKEMENIKSSLSEESGTKKRS